MGLGNVEDGYIVSPLPWVTSSAYTTSIIRHDFSKVTRHLIVKNHGPGELAFAFTRNGVQGTNRFVVSPGSAFESLVACKELYVVALATTTSGSIFAGLSMTSNRTMPLLTGSLWDGVG